ncbi:MAG: hypothetical protein JRH15_03880, partial [Deltaproteobacteria bacterium]|nr:hypothetical protein [Deltaproteobacteria bacterium]
DLGMPIPNPSPLDGMHLPNASDRTELGIRLLSAFLVDGKIRGVTANGEYYHHTIAEPLTRRFLSGLQKVRIRGVK